jgi:hypothetical protein
VLGGQFIPPKKKRGEQARDDPMHAKVGSLHRTVLLPQAWSLA